MKRINSIFLKFLLLNLFIGIFFYSNGQTVKVDYSVSNLSPGQQITVPIVIDCVHALQGYDIYIDYNKSVLTYVSSNSYWPATGDLIIDDDISYTNGFNLSYYQGNNLTSTYTNQIVRNLVFIYNGGTTSLNVNTDLSILYDYSFTNTYSVTPNVINGSVSGSAVSVTNGGLWSSTSSWIGNTLPVASDNVIVASALATPLVVDADVTLSGNLTINSNSALTVNSGKTLAVSGNFTIKSNATGTGSFINNGTSAITATVERYLSAYTSNTDGWRLVSSPVGTTAIGNFSTTQGDGNDFFKYDEANNLWQNYNQGSFGFVNGMGYLCAYSSSGVKSFSGTLNNSNVTISNQSYTPGQGNGWHLYGNPFASAIELNGGWVLNNVNAIAKILNNGGGYTDLSLPTDVIPAMQGFLAQVTSATNTLTIPTAARVHSVANLLNKSAVAERLTMKVSSLGNNTYVESVVRTNNSATNAFDTDFDANFLAGLNGVPQLFSIVNNKSLSTNTIPVIGSNVVAVPMGFVSGAANVYKLTVEGINTFNCSSIILEDLKTNVKRNLMQYPVYNFTATASDNVNRFVLHFNNTALDVNEINQTTSNIYSYGNDIYVNSTETVKQISIYNSIGQLIYTANNPQGLFKYSLNDKSTGYYIVKVITDKNVNSEKVFVK